MRLEDLKPNAAVRGILPDCLVMVVGAQWFGSEALELTYKDPGGRLGNLLLYRHDEPRLDVVEQGRPWSFDGDGALFRLVSEAHRIRLAHLFDPVLAVHTSLVEPLPHQITAVYDAMLPRQPLRFLLADDPGAGKTIMAGLLMKELIARGDLQRCLVVCPGSLAEQWQDELYRRFHLRFDILTNDKLEAAATGNWFLETNLAIARLDKLSRNEDVQAKLAAPNCRWDLIVCDEAHKMSATFFGGEIKYTKRYKLGQLLSTLTRHFLLMTATPHNGKEEDFQLFMALLDGDRFEGRFRDGVHTADVSDLMRRMVKEGLLKFDATPLFPERIAYTVPYKLSDAESQLYKAVTDYVREEFNRAEALQNDKRAGTVGFALTILQRRLASSPEAIFQSLRRRRERLESRLRELELLQRGGEIAPTPTMATPTLDAEEVEDLEDAPDDEVAATEEEILDQATAARTITELKGEIESLRRLETLALAVRRSGEDKKWRELASLLGEIFTPAALAGQVAEPQPPPPYGAIPKPEPSPRQKLIIFTEHRDTLSYLEQRVTTLLGRKDAVVIVHGGMGREERMKAQESFRHDPEVQVLLATDAAGEGVNLQRAHLMVNYDLPWNPNRIEQRFGRIHRIGQTEVCHLWNLVAQETREGDVYRTLLEKLEQARQALGGRVFDVLGKLQFEGRPLRELLIEAIRYGEQPEVRARLTQVIANAVDRQQLQNLLEERALAHDAMDASRVHRIREEMERADARRLQPHYIESFFLEAFGRLGGTVKQREPRRYEVTHVPAPIRNRDRLIGIGEPVLPRYERIAFEKPLVAPQGEPLAAFVCPGHPLLDATIDLTLERHRDLLRRGTVLVDERDLGVEPRVLFYLEHAIQDASLTRSGERRAVSKRMLYVELDAAGTARHLHYAPYLDYRPLKEDEPAIDAILGRPECAWITRELEQAAQAHAITHVVPEHLEEVRSRKLGLVAKTEAAVKDRLTKEITYWDHRAEELKLQERAGRPNARLNSGEARKRADALQARLEKRLDELKLERQLAHDGSAVEEFYAALPGPVTIGIESTGYATWFHTLMQRLGHTLLVGDAAKIRAMVVRKTKTDRRDALHILDLLHHDRFPTIWIPDPATRDLRALLMHRMRLVRIRTMVKNGLHAIALNYRLTRGSTLLRQAGLAQLHALALPPHTAQRRDQSLALLANLNTQVRELDDAIRTAALAHPDAPRLITHPGVGALTALATVVVLGPVARFHDSKHVVSYVGLAPAVNASASTYHLGRITKQGSPLLRFVLGQAAAHAARMNPDLKRAYGALVHRRGRPKAKVAVARKLLVRLFIMLRDQIDYDEFCRRGRTAPAAA